MRYLGIILLVWVLIPLRGVAHASDLSYLDVTQLAGDATSPNVAPTSQAFSNPVPGLNNAQLALHIEGDKRFESHFSDDPERPEYGLGPVFNNSSCIACHNLDGRGSLPLGLKVSNWTKIRQNEAIFLRISIENKDILARKPDAFNQYDAPVAVPGFSTQLFHLGSFQLRPNAPGTGQAEVWAKLEKSEFVYPDGTKVELSKPVFQIRNPYDQKEDPVTHKMTSRLWADDVHMGPRMSMPMIGLGSLEAVPPQEILDLAKIDHSAEGVHGQPNWVYDVEKDRAGVLPARSLGRFGLKANTPTVLHQSLGALAGDMGVTSSFFPIENIAGTPLFENFKKRSPYAKSPEASDQVAEALTFYARTLAVPPRRNIDDPEVRRGGRLFNQIRCTSCHVPSMTTGASDVKSFAYQTIYPFTDGLLHDMGEGLADHRQDFMANGRQWRTRPLWGIGLTKVLDPRAGYLHDGRARTLEEAILWHDGEGRYSRDHFARLSKADRAAVLKFLKSL